MPLSLDRDIGGPIGRTVRDVAKLFTYIVGPDPTDPLTSLSNDANAIPAGGYEQFLVPNGLRVRDLPLHYEMNSIGPYHQQEKMHAHDCGIPWWPAHTQALLLFGSCMLLSV